MNETEKRRKKLLEHTRTLYKDDTINPAVHPRYKTAYDQLYQDNSDRNKSTLRFRILISILLLFAYISMGAKDISVLEMDNMQIRNKIMHNYYFTELF